MSTAGPVTLSRTHFAVILALSLVALPAVGALFVSPQWSSIWCLHFEMPGYEDKFGFRLGPLSFADGQTITGVAWVAPGGPFAKAGIRAGDLVQMHHGLDAFCSALASAAEGGVGKVSVVNVDMRGSEPRYVSVRLKE